MKTLIAIVALAVLASACPKKTPAPDVSHVVMDAMVVDASMEDVKAP